MPVMKAIEVALNSSGGCDASAVWQRTQYGWMCQNVNVHNSSHNARTLSTAVGDTLGFDAVTLRYDKNEGAYILRRKQSF